MRHFQTISEFHEFRQLPKPQHPLISVVDVGTVPPPGEDEPSSLLLDFYTISVKRIRNVHVKYGQHPFDFKEGILSFMAPNQVFSIAVDNKDEAVEQAGWVIFIHPDFLWNTPLATTIKHYDFWDYSLSEALFLSAKEEAAIITIILAIEQEYRANIDRFSKQIIISQVEGLLNYADRFYHRQFITREKANHQVLEQVEKPLRDYFNSHDLVERGLPTVRYVAEHLHLSPKYLSNLLRVL